MLRMTSCSLSHADVFQITFCISEGWENNPMVDTQQKYRKKYGRTRLYIYTVGLAVAAIVLAVRFFVR